MRQTLCTSCLPDDEPCEYDLVPLAADDETPWGTTPAADIATLELSQHGTWRWGESTEYLDIDQSGFELPAWASFVHDPETVRYSEHVDGGRGVACNGPTVSVDGTLTISSEADEVILSVPLTVLREFGSVQTYLSTPQYSPISSFSAALSEKAKFDMTQVFGSMIWIDGVRLQIEFFYHGQSMLSETTGGGVFTLVGKFEGDE
ncbi:hypothetical protein ENSA7_60240 [Enhygromyxa salina]|uniref:Uncharacterized protein n=2 Tax=Enhygromyxa salina TaxID=215803 RepID=A0A2S9Y601_9BACT|nr:hypothetical protein ENSA7_60240 [Enhygromyxa salina]